MRAEAFRRKQARPETREPAGTEHAPAAETRQTHSATAHTGRGRHCGETPVSVDRGRWRTPSLARCARRCRVTSTSRRAETAPNLEERSPGPTPQAQGGAGPAQQAPTLDYLTWSFRRSATRRARLLG